MSIIGERIKKYRVERGITQEQLGELIGVTTQAVSRWERGGTPDAELLPSLSQVLGVSIDSLFGQEEQSLNLTLARRLSRMPQEEAFRYAFSICWAIQRGLMGDPAAIDDFLGTSIEDISASLNSSNNHFGKVIRDRGMSSARLSPDFFDFFLLVEPEKSLKDRLVDIESLRKVFAIFADENILSVISYLCTMPMIRVSSSLVAKSTGIAIAEVERCMEVLCENHLVMKSVVSTADGDINSYGLCPESLAIPLFCFADEVARKDYRVSVGLFDRKKTFL